MMVMSSTTAKPFPVQTENFVHSQSMEIASLFKNWFEQECSGNAAMLKMLLSVPEAEFVTDKYQRALELAAHIAACRENWLDRMAHGGHSQLDWWPKGESIDAVSRRFERVEVAWREYLLDLSDEALEADFDFLTSDGGLFRWNFRGQLMQLVGHAYYHRGQVSLLVADLGGVTTDTDYLYWALDQQPDRWKRLR